MITEKQVQEGEAAGEPDAVGGEREADEERHDAAGRGEAEELVGHEEEQGGGEEQRDEDPVLVAAVVPAARRWAGWVAAERDGAGRNHAVAVSGSAGV